MSYFFDTAVNIEGNKKLRIPQIEAYIKIKEYFKEPDNREALVVLPTGTGKSGLISIAPYGVSNKRVLIITPGLVTKDSIRKTQEVLEDNFWINYDIIFSSKDIPVVNEYLPDISDEHLGMSNIVYSNIHKVSGNRNSSLINRVPPDFFDLIIIDEAHHAPAQSWKDAIRYFSNSKILHVTGTPYRGDNQEIPGDKIHETPLSEVMRDRYVKWLRKETINSHELYFYTPDIPGVKLTKEEVLDFKDKEWLEKSIALSEECSKSLIEHSLKKLAELKQLSSAVPHKILAVGCSIAHANDLYQWYKEKGYESVIVHSEMPQDEINTAFKKIELNQCDVVISVNMLMEGYDHKYLSILAIFRPYRSLNSFAQVVGRILRAIPDNEITAFEIDNNGLVIYHEEIGLNSMWEVFQKEVNRAEKRNIREYTFNDREYLERDNAFAGIDSEGTFVSDQDSYLEEIDFNELFEKKREEINNSVIDNINKIAESGVNLSPEMIKAIKIQLAEEETRKVAGDTITPALIDKRPALARKEMRQMLTRKIQDEVSNLLIDNNIEEKGSSLYPNFERHILNLETNAANDGILVRYVNLKISKAFGPVSRRDNKTLLQSMGAVAEIIKEVKRMIQ
ncbi:DEAD/DEAH box helicase [Xenorhabdus bovienii]|uniref:DEAD/DEAH box helicase n=1 Tax=Xenorhabdus bovienii TaxID=40576 RepID=UPI0023B29C49|nr:DEAD/DEAH box helicase family protein [Xenorhabdus bovienii]MDE9427421.1 DEAD/DEAH box helicase family protein [Xenorhabdus bovienii]